MVPDPAIAPAEPIRPFAGVEFVVVDVETTGWLPGEARITEVGAVRIRGGVPGPEFSALVNPGTAIPGDVASVTGINDAMVAAAPRIGTVLPALLAFASGGMLTAHNAPFDVGFLTAACADCGLAWPSFPVVDTAALARLMLGEPEVPDHKLSTLAEFFGTQARPCHRALPDAKATAEVLLALLGRLAATGVITVAEAPARPGVAGVPA